MRKSLDSDVLEAALGRIARASRRTGLRPPIRPQPLHTLVVPADRFRHDGAARAGVHALKVLQTLAPDSIVLARTLRLPGWERLPTDPERADELLWRVESSERHHAPPEARLAHEVYERVVRRLERMPVHDLRVDLHEGFSRRADADEADATAAAVAEEIGRGHEERSLPPRIGIRLPPLDARTAERAFHLLDCAASTLVDRVGAEVPPLVVSLADVSMPAQVAAVAQVLATIEQRLSLKKGILRIEVELASADGLFDEEGRLRIPATIAAAAGRCVGLVVEGGLVRDLVCACAADVPVGSGPPPVREPLRERDTEAVLSAWRALAERVAGDDLPWGADRDPALLPARLAASFAAVRRRLPDLCDAVADALANTRPDDPAEVHAEGQRRFDRLLRAVDSGAADATELVRAGTDAEDVAVGSFRAAVDRRRA